MSGFFGIFRPQGGSVDLEAFEQMRKATVREGFDGLETHVEDKITMGHLLLRVSPESKYDKQPLKSDCGNYMLVGHFRLDYRDELGDKLGLTQSELELTPDSQLVMLAYIKWLEKCVHHIEGDWAFSIFNKAKNSLFFAKDRGGYSSLFYSLYDEKIYFSSDLNALVDAKVIPVDIDNNQLCRIGITGVELTNGFTLFKNIFHVKSANFIIFDFKSLLFENEYWKLNPKQTLRYKFDFDCIKDFESLLAQATSSRSRTKHENGIFLSSGLDSTTVAYFSAKKLEYENKKLTSYTSFPYYLDFNGLKNSFRFREDLNVQNFIKDFQNIKGNFLDFPDVKYSDLFLVNQHFDYYSPCLSNNTFWLNGILELAIKKNVKNILNGQLGNYVISWNAPGLDLYFLLNLKLRSFFRRAWIASFENNFSVLKYLKTKVYRPLRSLLKLKFSIISQSNKSFIFSKSVIKKTFTPDFDLNKEKRSFGFIPGLTIFLNPRSLRFSIFSKNFTNIGMKWFELSHSYALQTSDPTSDVRVVNFSFSIDEQFFSKQGLEKYLLRNLMEYKIPEFILMQPKSYFQSIDIGKRISNDTNIDIILKEIKSNRKFQTIVDFNELESAIQDLNFQKKKFLDILFLSSKSLKMISFFYFLKRTNYI